MGTLGERKAVFLDWDGVLIEDHGPLTRPEGIILDPTAPRALRRLKDAGYQLIVVSNQTAISRGLLSEDEVRSLQAEVEARLCQAGGVPLDGFYFCPHHPRATQAAYRKVCDCRKPAPGLLRQASEREGLDLAHSVMIGDRSSDVVAGLRAGCRTILVETGRHLDPQIEVLGGPQRRSRHDLPGSGGGRPLPGGGGGLVKALVLCAGFGRRLGSLCQDSPKPLLEVGGLPIVEHILRRLGQHGVEEVFINLHYRAEQFPARLGDGGRFGFPLRYLHEPAPLGTAGTARDVLARVDGDLLVHYALGRRRWAGHPGRPHLPCPVRDDVDPASRRRHRTGSVAGWGRLRASPSGRGP